MEMVKRLFWKEAIRSWPLVVLGAVLPAQAFGWLLPRLRQPIFGSFAYGQYDVAVVTATLGILLLAVIVWVSVTAAGERFRRSYASVHFPISPTLAPMIGFTVQFLLGTAVGLSAGLWCIHSGPLLPAAIILFFAAVAGICFLMGMAGLSSGTIALALFAIYGVVRLAQALTHQSAGTDPKAEMVAYSLCALLALLIAMIIQMLPGDLSRQARQGVSFTVLTAILIGFPTLKPMVDGWRKTDFPPRFDYRQLATPDGTLSVSYLAIVGLKTPFPKTLKVKFSDFPRQRHGEMTSDCPVLPVGFLGRDAVLLALQRPGEREITLLRWEPSTNTLQPLFAFTAGRRALLNMMYYPASTAGPLGSVSPSGQYALLAVPSPYGRNAGDDIWLLDLSRRQARLVLPVVYLYQATVGWAADTAVLTQEFNGSYRISLSGGTAVRYTLKEAR